MKTQAAAAETGYSSVSFLKPVETKASAALWMAAVVSLFALVTLNMYPAIVGGGISTVELVGRFLGTLAVPGAALWFASRSPAGKSQRAKVKVVLFTCAGFLALAVATSLSTYAYGSGSIVVRVAGASPTDLPAISKVLQARVDGLRTNWVGSTSVEASGDTVNLTFSGWAPNQQLAAAVLQSNRSLRLIVAPSSGDVLLTEADVSDARPGIGARAKLDLRLNESGMNKLQARGAGLVGKIIDVYWDDQLISKPRVDAPLVRDIAITVPGEGYAVGIAAILRAGALPPGVAVTLAQ